MRGGFDAVCIFEVWIVMFFTEIAVFCVRKVASFEVIVLRLLCPEMTLVLRLIIRVVHRTAYILLDSLSFF